MSQSAYSTVTITILGMINYKIDKIKFQPPLLLPIVVTIQYKYYLDEDWITVATEISVATDGTLSSPQTLTDLEPNKIYTIRAINDMCETVYQENILYPCTNTCPDGYTLAPDASYCYKILTEDAIPPVGSPDTLTAKTNINYSACGAYIYNSGYSTDGTGVSSQIALSNAFWKNGVGDCSTGNISDGALNRCGVWASATTDNQDIGFSICVDIETSKTYYIAMGVDNYGTVKLDGVIIIQQNAAALDAQYGLSGGFATFKVWHIYPVQLTAGIHIIELLGHNLTLSAAVGFEIYDNTKAEIIAATDYTDLNIVFSTKDEVGNTVLLGSGGYSCPSGYALSACDSPIVCKKILTVDAVC